MEPFIGMITLFAGNFAPKGWAFCQGQLLPISQNSALFSLLGTTYGGDGVTTFALPDLRGRAPIQQGQGPGLSNYVLGEITGTENVTLTNTQLPAHTHSIVAAVGAPSGTIRALEGQLTDSPIDETIGVTGGGEPFPVVQPILAINFIIALEGVYPSRG